MQRFFKIGVIGVAIAVSVFWTKGSPSYAAMTTNLPALVLQLEQSENSNSAWRFRVKARNVSSSPIVVDRELRVFFCLKVNSVEGVAIQYIHIRYLNQPVPGKWEQRFTPLQPGEEISRDIDLEESIVIFEPAVMFTAYGEMPSATEVAVRYQVP